MPKKIIKLIFSLEHAFFSRVTFNPIQKRCTLCLEECTSKFCLIPIVSLISNSPMTRASESKHKPSNDFQANKYDEILLLKKESRLKVKNDCVINKKKADDEDDLQLKAPGALTSSSFCTTLNK